MEILGSDRPHTKDIKRLLLRTLGPFGILLVDLVDSDIWHLTLSGAQESITQVHVFAYVLCGQALLIDNRTRGVRHRSFPRCWSTPTQWLMGPHPRESPACSLGHRPPPPWDWVPLRPIFCIRLPYHLHCFLQDNGFRSWGSLRWLWGRIWLYRRLQHGSLHLLWHSSWLPLLISLQRPRITLGVSARPTR